MFLRTNKYIRPYSTPITHDRMPSNRSCWTSNWKKPPTGPRSEKPPQGHDAVAALHFAGFLAKGDEQQKQRRLAEKPQVLKDKFEGVELAQFVGDQELPHS